MGNVSEENRLDWRRTTKTCRLFLQLVDNKNLFQQKMMKCKSNHFTTLFQKEKIIQSLLKFGAFKT